MGKNIPMKIAGVQLGITQKQLSEAIGVSRQTINAIEKEEYNPAIKRGIGYLQSIRENP